MVILKDTEAWVSGFESVIEKWLEAILNECFFYLAIKYFRKSSKKIKIEKKRRKKKSSQSYIHNLFLKS